MLGRTVLVRKSQKKKKVEPKRGVASAEQAKAMFCSVHNPNKQPQNKQALLKPTRLPLFDGEQNPSFLHQHTNFFVLADCSCFFHTCCHCLSANQFKSSAEFIWPMQKTTCQSASIKLTVFQKKAFAQCFLALMSMTSNNSVEVCICCICFVADLPQTHMVEESMPLQIMKKSH